MPSPPSPLQNHLLAALPDEVGQRLLPHVQVVELHPGQTLYESGIAQGSVYFPVSCTVSLLHVMENGATAEVAVVGPEGLLGFSALMGGEPRPCRAVVLHGGAGFLLSAQRLQDEFNRAGALMQLLLRYTQAFICQVSQTAVCNRHHSIDQQLCRWLLLSVDRQPGRELLMTQELIAGMLGVRREGITEAAGKLQHAGLINYRRGHIKVLDRLGLEARACECYAAVEREYRRLLPAPRALGF